MILRQLTKLIKPKLVRNQFINTSIYKELQDAEAKTSDSIDSTKRRDDKDETFAKELSFVINTFVGLIEPAEIFPYPDTLSHEEKEFLRLLVQPISKFFLEKYDASKSEKSGKISDTILKNLWNLGVFAVQVPAEYGGLGLTNTQNARLTEEIGMHDLSLGVMLAAHQLTGFRGIMTFGNKQQKEKYLPRVSNGEYAAFCLTESSSGSDASSIKTRATLSSDGKHFILNGSKVFVNNGDKAEIMTVFAQTSTKNEIDNDDDAIDNVTAFIVERSFGGVTSSTPEEKMGIHSVTVTSITYDNVKVPVENILGEFGQGLKIAVSIVNEGRYACAAALGGTMRTCIKTAIDFANNRNQAGKQLKHLQGVQEKIATMSMLQYVVESIAYMIAANIDSGSKHYHTESAISKCFASESAWYVCDEAIQILGGIGLIKESGLEKILRDLRSFRIFQGSNDAIRLYVALNGIRYAGAGLKELDKSITSSTINMGIIFGVASKQVKHILGLKSIINFDKLVHPELVHSSRLIANAISTFSKTIEHLLKTFNKSIVEKQSILHRIADCSILIYTSSVALSRASTSLNSNLPTAIHETHMAQAYCYCSHKKIMYILSYIHKEDIDQHFDMLSAISKNTFEAGGVVTTNPLETEID